MKALRYYGARDIRCESMDAAPIADDREAIIKVDRCAICGGDLHIYYGRGFLRTSAFASATKPWSKRSRLEA